MEFATRACCCCSFVSTLAFRFPKYIRHHTQNVSKFDYYFIIKICVPLLLWRRTIPLAAAAEVVVRAGAAFVAVL